MKGLRFLFTWTTILILSEPKHNTTELCYHDVLHQHVLREGDSPESLSQLNGQTQRRQKRMAGARDIYNPIRITTVYSLNQHLLVEEQIALRLVLERAVRKITSLLSVVSMEGPLLLARDACPVIFRKGVNRGKCAKIQKGYSGQYCLDNFRIPSDHLEGLYVYNMTSPDPVKTYAKDGPGLADTDFVLYVTTDTTPLCNPYKTSALAYAAFCQLDTTGRPIAGQVNFCPRTLKMQKFDEKTLYKTAIHELFHALGFSNKLFDKFRTCSEGVCHPWPQPILKPVEGTTRLVTSAVMREMKKHFNCSSEPEFGGPLEVVNGRATSHWNPLLMHSSIMGSKEQKPYLSLIDPISLAVFEDTGWYQVNYSQADMFIWGQGQGCTFGLPGVCQRQQGFCTRNITGCHHLRLSKARCNVNTNVSSTCGVFAADQEPAPGVVTGKCYERKCEGDKYFVRVKDGEWLPCQPGSYIQVPGFEGQIECPSHQEICSQFVHPEPPADITTPSMTLPVDTSTQGHGEAFHPASTTQNPPPCTSPACSTTDKGRNSAVGLCPLTLVTGILAAISGIVSS